MFNSLTTKKCQYDKKINDNLYYITVKWKTTNMCFPLNGLNINM